ncbi:ester cyclase [Pedobacter chinensis]|uniref:Ester cyclase n=1 Tax=Pedobacter chinensis TaxID=2282421 RepID=A0A369PPE2_9SPHI|nr:ester cyclase [Pedobacter chinensis]RDC54404.1 ester cyclase [Pedobacter chinensis]
MDNQVEKNKAICKVFFDELFNNANLEAIDKFVDSGVTVHHTFPWQRKGAKAFYDTVEIFKIGFPDLKIKFSDILGEDDKVMCKFTVTGTHKEMFMNIPATGKKIEYEEVNIVRLKDEKITEHWVVADTYSLMQKITGNVVNPLV